MERKLNSGEKRLMLFLLSRAHLPIHREWLDDVKVLEMKDGGMGGIRFPPFTCERKMSRQAAELQFKDADGVDVVASLNLDDDEQPYELDLWKVNFDKLIRIPDVLCEEDSRPG